MKTDTKLQFVTTFSALITAAFGLVAALAWNQAIKAAIDEVLGPGSNLVGLFIYAILVTILAVIMILIIARQTKKLTDQIKAEDKE
ncbi:hypothetical protein Mpt1_c11000 [Candidatus Methanoplasma termitum]|uniref:Uncharacterized protein n=1 Tax=Candidatus Methanoplasma termitum TaxID=1577791 RepID=A0A0A7LF79_9ARCH|nr:DUF5654 family protein [Candidatus Methanoplasma termitum]AIZ56967.1 hypothetical protein Mpt1_c11000 [Candidatus Methanoplasma termitum]MCL2333281.1 DUF5654 family protein [Candidatus Methanoplasma sp.]